jgi:hypothetical protein
MKSKDQLLLEEAYETVSESLNNPYPYELSTAGADDAYIFYPNPDNKDVFYSVTLLEDITYNDLLRIVFTYTDKSKKIRRMTDMTGTGDAFRVMATVAKIVTEHLRKYAQSYSMIDFEAKSSDHGRVALYKRLAQKLKNEVLGPKWKLETSNDEKEKSVRFLFKRVYSREDY